MGKGGGSGGRRKKGRRIKGSIRIIIAEKGKGRWAGKSGETGTEGEGYGTVG